MTRFQYLESTTEQMVASHVTGFAKTEAIGAEATSYTFTPRIPHPQNMMNYEKWANDPEASIAYNVLTDLIAGVGFYTKMPEEVKVEKGTKHPHQIVIEQFKDRVNLEEDLQEITMQMLQKGFAPVQILPDYDLHILPSETFYIWRLITGEIIRYTQERSYGDVIRSWEQPRWKETLQHYESYYPAATFKETMSYDAPADLKPGKLDEIKVFFHRQTKTQPYGKSLSEPIGSLLDTRNAMNIDLSKVLHRLGFPIPVMYTARDKAALDSAIENREPDQWITMGNVNKDEFGFDVIEVATRSQPHEWIDLINMQIAEGLHAPLLLYLKNATEASATVMMESVDRLVNGVQKYEGRRVEKYLFEPQVGEPIPKLVWGQPKTGLEKVTLTELGSIINSPKLANNQAQELIKMFFPNLPEPQWEKGPQPQPFQPFQKQPFQKTPTQLPMEQILEKMNDLGTSLSLIETAYKEHRIMLTEAMQYGDRAITVHMKRIHREESVVKTERELEFEKWTHRLMGVKAKTYNVTVGSN